MGDRPSITKAVTGHRTPKENMDFRKPQGNKERENETKVLGN
jgi:hypothetical protein